MTVTEEKVEQHYSRADLFDAIIAGLAAAGKDTKALKPEDLAPVDEFHVRGREATLELAQWCKLDPNHHVLDIGSGLGGSARFLASAFGCRVTGVDLTEDYCRVARRLAEALSLSSRVDFRQGSALDLPFAPATFDVAWTEHAQMNIADKRRFYGEAYRVLKPGGKLVFHDIFQGPGGPLSYPMPWANSADYSFLATPEDARATLEGVGFRALQWNDGTPQALAWYRVAAQRAKTGGPPPLGLHLLMGKSSADKLMNGVRNTEERRMELVLAVLEKPR